MLAGVMKRLVILAIVAIGGAQLVSVFESRLVHAQPVMIGWRPPAGCSVDQVIKWTGTTWVCGGTGISGLTTGTIPKATSATTIGNSTLADDGTYVYTPSQIWGKWSLTSGVAIAGGAPIVSTTAADVGFDFALAGGGTGDVIWRNKLATGGHITAYVGEGTSAGNTTQWLSVDGSGNANFPKHIGVGPGGISGGYNLGISDVDADIEIQLSSTAAGGRSFLVGSGATASGIPNSFYIYDATAPATRFTINSSGVVRSWGALQADGDVTIGNSTTDSHTFNGTINIVGTGTTGYFNYSTNEDVYIRAGKVAGFVSIGDVNSGGVQISAASYTTTVLGAFTVNNNTTLGDATTDTTIASGPLTALRITPTTQLFDYTRGFEFFDDFLSSPVLDPVSDATWYAAGTNWQGCGGIGSSSGWDGNHPGVVGLTSYTSTDTLNTFAAPSHARLIQGSRGTNCTGDGWTKGGGTTKGAVMFQIGNLSPPIDDIDSYTLTVGMFDDLDSAHPTGDHPVDGIYCRADSVSGNWRTCSSLADVRTCNATSPTIAITEDDWIRCEWTVNAAGTQVDFTVTNVDLGTTGTASHTTNLPTTGIGLGVSVDRVDNAGFAYVYVDYAWLDQTFTTAR